VNNVKCNNETLFFCSEAKYLGVTLDRSLRYRQHLESLRKKLTSRVALLRRLAGFGWGAGATTLRIATLALLHSTAEYCAPVWCRSAHTRHIDPAINDALRIVTGCLRPTPANNLPTLAGIQPAELRRNGATLSLAPRAMERGHLLHSALTRPSSANARRLKSRHLFVPAAQHLIRCMTATYVRRCGRITNGMRSGRTAHKTPHFHPRHRHPPPGMTLPRSAGSGLTVSAPVSDVSAPVCTNGAWPPLRSVSVAQKNNIDHVVLQCSIHRPPHGLHGLTVLEDETIEWLLNTCPEIECGQTVV